MSFYARIDQCDCRAYYGELRIIVPLKIVGTCVVVMYEIREMPKTIECALSDTVAVNVLIHFTSE